MKVLYTTLFLIAFNLSTSGQNNQVDRFFEDPPKEAKNTFTFNAYGLVYGEAVGFYERKILPWFAAEVGYGKNLAYYNPGHLNNLELTDDIDSTIGGNSLWLAGKFLFSNFGFLDQVYLSGGAVQRRFDRNSQQNKIRSYAYRLGGKYFIRNNLVVEGSFGNLLSYHQNHPNNNYKYYSFAMEYQLRVGFIF